MLQVFISSGIYVIVKGWHFWMFLTHLWSDCFFLQVRKSIWNTEVPQQFPNANTSQNPSDLPADLLHRHTWCDVTTCIVSTFPFIFSEHASIFQDGTWKFFWVINCYSETLAWRMVLEQFVLSVATFSQ